MTLRVAIYARVSTEEQYEEGHSIDAQIRLCREFAAARGWAVVGEYIDIGISGTTTNRPRFQEMLRDARSGRVDLILVHKLDRFSRSLVDTLTTLAHLSQRGIAFCSVAEAQFDFSTVMGKIILAVLAGLAELFIENLRAETKKGKKERALKGLYNGIVPFGYQMTAKEDGGVPVFHPENIKGYQHMLQLCLKDKSNREIADWLNANGYRTSGNRGRNLFTPDAVGDILKNRFYLGMVAYKGVWREAKHKPATDPATWEACQQKLRTRASRRETTKTTDRVYPLRKLVFCAMCGEPLRGQPIKGVRRYKDMGAVAHKCGGPQTVDAAEVENQVGGFLHEATLPQNWRDQILKRAGKGSDAASAEAARKRLVGEMTRARKLYIAGDLPDAEYQKIKARVEVELDKHKPVQAPELERAASVLESAGTLWQHATQVEQLELAHMLFEKVWLRAGQLVAIEPRAAFYPLLSLAANKKTSSAIRITLDVPHWRERRVSNPRSRP